MQLGCGTHLKKDDSGQSQSWRSKTRTSNVTGDLYDEHNTRSVNALNPFRRRLRPAQIWSYDQRIVVTFILLEKINNFRTLLPLQLVSSFDIEFVALVWPD